MPKRNTLTKSMQQKVVRVTHYLKLATKDKPITLADLQRKLMAFWEMDMNVSQVKTAIHHARSLGFVNNLVGTHKGYYIATDIVELEDYEHRLRVQAAKVLQLAETVKSWRKEMSDGQFVMRFGAEEPAVKIRKEFIV